MFPLDFVALTIVEFLVTFLLGLFFLEASLRFANVLASGGAFLSCFARSCAASSVGRSCEPTPEKYILLLKYIYL